MSNRISIPAKIDRDLRVINLHRCCICEQHDIQLHHIDGNPANNNPENLAVLCQLHHDQAERAKSGEHGLTKNLDKQVIERFKQLREEKNVVGLGFATVRDFWRLAGKVEQHASNQKVKFQAVAIKSISSWEALKDRLAAYSAVGKFPYRIRFIEIDSHTWVLVECAAGDENPAKEYKWTRCADCDAYEEKLSSEIAGYEFVACSQLGNEIQLEANSKLIEILEQRDVFEKVGVLAVYRINGPQPWPAERNMQFGAWLQHVAVLRKYYSLLGDYRARVGELSAEISLSRAMNLNPKISAGLSAADYTVAERAEILSTLVIGKGLLLRDDLEAVVKMKTGWDYDRFLNHIASASDLEIDWRILSECVAIAISKLSQTPQAEEEAIKSISPVLAFRNVRHHIGSKFFLTTKVWSLISPNRTGHITPDQSGQKCNLEIILHNYLKITAYPSTRPDSLHEWHEKLNSIDVHTMFRLLRTKDSGINVL